MAKGLLDTAADAGLLPQYQKIVDSLQLDEVGSRILLAGKKLMYAKDMAPKLLDGLQDVEDAELPATIGRGVAGVIVMLQRRAKGTMPTDAMIKAATALLMEALDFLTKKGVVEASNAVISESLMSMTEVLLASLGVTKQAMGNLMTNAQSVMADPAKMDAYAKSRGGK